MSGSAVRYPMSVAPINHRGMPLCLRSVQEEFRAHLAGKGIITNAHIASDGELHRFHIEGHRSGSLNGAYVLHGDSHPAGWFKDHKSGLSGTWSLTREKSKVSDGELKAIRLYQRQAQAKAEDRYVNNSFRAERICAKAVQVFHHGYLASKNITSCRGLLVASDDTLLVPVCDLGGKIWSVQRIYQNGRGKFEKRFLAGCRTSGCLFRIKGDEVLGVCEGIATGISLRKETGHTIFSAFSASNLVKVAKELRSRHPASRIIVYADNDCETEGNPGLTKGREAAKAIHAELHYPPIAGDFNDFLDGGNGQ